MTMHDSTAADRRAAEFRRLHTPGDPFILPCAWDVASARFFAEAGHRAIGTTSLGVAAGIGAADEDRETLTAMSGLIRAMREVLPEGLLTCDFEDGNGDGPESVVETLGTSLAMPERAPPGLAVEGINVEDSAFGRLTEPAGLAATIAAIKAAFPDLFVNARIDTFWLGGDDLGDVLTRIETYAEAGADGIFVPGNLDLAAIRTIVDRSPLPVNVLAIPDLPLSALAEAGVARISTGSLLYRTAQSAGLRSLAVLDSGRPAETKSVLSYQDVANPKRAQSSS
jgi:2-methylisocitrate lyase-like PEP mutase family enzyme